MRPPSRHLHLVTLWMRKQAQSRTGQPGATCEEETLSSLTGHLSWPGGPGRWQEPGAEARGRWSRGGA